MTTSSRTGRAGGTVKGPSGGAFCASLRCFRVARRCSASCAGVLCSAATMAGYVDTSEDDGGVHINSGIPNHAFYLAAAGIGGHAWEGAGRVWFDVLTSPTLPAASTFATFGTATVHAARRRFGHGSAEARAVSDAWHQVGVHAR